MLFTALIGPHFVDWTSYRETFEREASAFIGRPVTVDGKASVRLLPTPVLSFTDIHVGDSENPDVEMERFRAELDLAPLLKGEYRIIQMAVERPRFNIDIAGLADNRSVFADDWRLDPDRISLERLEIIEGSALISDSANERAWRAETIDAVIEASTLLGPGRAEASMVLAGEPIEVRAGFGRFTNLNTVATNLFVTSPNWPVTLSTDGTLHISRETPPSYEGTATVEGAPPAESDTSPSRWADFRASGAFALEPADLTLEQMQISYGATERPLIVEATGQIGFGDRPRFDIALGARQIDLDRTLGTGEEGPIAIETALASVVELLPRMAPPPLPGALRLDVQGVVVGGSLVQAVGIDLVTAGNSWVVEDFAAVLPGETRVDVSGTLGLSAETTFRGNARMRSRRPAAFANWWRGTADSAGRIGSFAVEADLDLASDNQQLTGLVATTENGTIEGSVGVRGFSQSGLVYANVDLRAERADLVETLALAELLVGRPVRGGAVDQMTLSLSAGTLSAGGVEARSILVEGGLEDGQLNLRQLSVADLAGASIDAHGSIQDPFGTPFGRVDASIQAEDVTGAAKFLLSVLPERRAVRHLAEVAPIVSPLNASILAEAGAEGERVSLELSGSFADTRLTLVAEGAGSLDKPETLTGTLSLHAVGEDSAKVLRQLGFDVLPVGAGPLRISAEFDGALASGGKLNLEGTAAGIDFAYEAETALNEGEVATAGELKAESDNIDQALLLGGIAVPGVGEGHAAKASGRLEYAGKNLTLALSEASFDELEATGSLTVDFTDGIKLVGNLDLAEASLPALASIAVGSVPDVEGFEWSDAPFAEPLPENVTLDLELNVASLDFGAPVEATDAALGFSLREGALGLDLAEAGFAGGTLKGTATAAMVDGQADLSIQADVQGAALQSLVWERVGLPVASGTLDVSLEANARGRSSAGLVATLVGSGSFTVEDGRLNALNTDALRAVMAAAEGETEPDDEAARETFATLFGSGAFAFGRATGSFSIANGAIEVSTVSLETDAAKVLADARLDLNTLTLRSDWTVRLEEGGQETAQPTVTMTFRGPIARPVREIDLVPLLDVLRSRFLQLKLEELEELQRQRDAAERRAQEEEAARQAAAEADLTTGATGTAGAGAVPSITPDRDPPANAASQSASPHPPASVAPLQLVPQEPSTAGAAQPPAAEPPPPDPQPSPGRRAQTSAQPPPVPPAPPQPGEPEAEFRTLPNGVVVKVR